MIEQYTIVSLLFNKVGYDSFKGKIMNRTKRQQKEQNRRRTKEEIHCQVQQMKKDGDDVLIVEANKRRTNITINEFVLSEIEKMHKNKSKLIEDYLINLVEEELGKKIEITKYKGNYPL